MSAVQITGIVVGDDHSGIQAGLTDGTPELVSRKIVASEAEAFALCKSRDQFPALWSLAIIDDSEANIRHRRAEREAKQRQLQDRRDNQREHETAVAADLVELFADECTHSMIDNVLKGMCHSITL